MTRVLVVDDCAVDRTLAGEILKKEAGFAIDYARSGEEALQQIERVAAGSRLDRPANGPASTACNWFRSSARSIRACRSS